MLGLGLVESLCLWGWGGNLGDDKGGTGRVLELARDEFPERAAFDEPEETPGVENTTLSDGR